MAIGERIHFFRLLRGMTQKCLGMAVGFPVKSADVRIAQYETGVRTPKANLTASLAKVLEVSPEALAVPDIESGTGIMHTLFALEDICGLQIGELGGEACLRADRCAPELAEHFAAWRREAAKLEQGEISKEEYDRWRYTYPGLPENRERGGKGDGGREENRPQRR